MGLGSLRRFDAQARLAAVTGFVSVVPMVAAAAIAMRNYNGDLQQIVYKQNAYAAALVGCAAGSILLGAVACVLGFNSADQRINDKPKLSWLGFFLGGGVVTLNLIILSAFVLLRLKQPG